MAAHAEGWPHNGDFGRGQVFGRLIRAYRKETAVAYTPPVEAEAAAAVPAVAAEVGPVAVALAAETPIPGFVLWLTEDPFNAGRFTPDQIADLRANHGTVTRPE